MALTQNLLMNTCHFSGDKRSATGIWLMGLGWGIGLKGFVREVSVKKVSVKKGFGLKDLTIQ